MIRPVLIAIAFLAVTSPGHAFKDQDFKVRVVPGHLAWLRLRAVLSPQPLPLEGFACNPTPLRCRTSV